jgi:hypothetical protein
MLYLITEETLIASILSKFDTDNEYHRCVFIIPLESDSKLILSAKLLATYSYKDVSIYLRYSRWDDYDTIEFNIYREYDYEHCIIKNPFSEDVEAIRKKLDDYLFIGIPILKQRYGVERIETNEYVNYVISKKID